MSQSVSAAIENSAIYLNLFYTYVPVLIYTPPINGIRDKQLLTDLFWFVMFNTSVHLKDYYSELSFTPDVHTLGSCQ